MAKDFREQITLSGEEQTLYLARLDSYLSALANSLGLGIDESQLKTIKDFGNSEKWDWTRLAAEADTYLDLGTLVEEVRKNYRWFDWLKQEKDPKMNRGYFEEIGISTSSGLPWIFDVMRLHDIRDKAGAELAGLKSYQDSSKELANLLRTDGKPIEQVPAEAERIYKSILRRSFLEQLQSTELIGWKSGGLRPIATKLLPFGGEDLWRIKHARAMTGSMYEVYVIDVWQDNAEPQILEKDGKAEVSQQLESSLKFGMSNQAWFVLKELDETFKSLHPVHISRGLVGPFENKYATQLDTLPITQEILGENPDFGILRFRRQYSYAPNQTTTKNKETRQVVYHQDWSDEVLVCPAQYATRVTDSVLGTNVRVVRT